MKRIKFASICFLMTMAPSLYACHSTSLLSEDSFVESGVSSSTEIIKKNCPVNQFSAIEINGVADVQYTQAPNFSVSISGSEVCVNLTEVYTKNDVLIIDTQKSSRKNNGLKKLKGATVLIKAPYLRKVNLNGVGSFYCPTAIKWDKDFTIDNNGVGRVDIKNIQCYNLTINNDGVGSTQVKATAKNIKASNDGVGSSNYIVECDNLDITSDGVGSTTVSGRTHRFTKHKDGFGSFNHKKLVIK